MEPPSSVNIETGILAGQQSDDPARAITADSYLVVSPSEEDSSDGGFFVSVYSTHAGLSYLGKVGTIES